MFCCSILQWIAVCIRTIRAQASSESGRLLSRGQIAWRHKRTFIISAMLAGVRIVSAAACKCSGASLAGDGKGLLVFPHPCSRQALGGPGANIGLRRCTQEGIKAPSGVTAVPITMIPSQV
jgi:hypothetical protein